MQLRTPVCQMLHSCAQTAAAEPIVSATGQLMQGKYVDFSLGMAEMTVKETKLPIEGIAEHSQELNLLAVFVWGI